MFTTPFSGSSSQTKWRGKKKKALSVPFFGERGHFTRLLQTAKTESLTCLKEKASDSQTPQTPPEQLLAFILLSAKVQIILGQVIKFKISLLSDHHQQLDLPHWQSHKALQSSNSSEVQVEQTSPSQGRLIPHPGVSCFPSQLKVISLSPAWQ